MGDEIGLLAAKEKARKIEESSIVKVFESSEFKGKQPFPSLESLEVTERLYYEEQETENLNSQIYWIMQCSRDIRVSPAFYELFLERTATLRSLNLSC